MRILKPIAFLALVIASSTFMPYAAHATPTPAGTGTQTVTTPAATTNTSANMQSSGQTIANPLKFNSLDELLNGLLAAAIKLGTIILTLALMWTGFKFIAARGNAEKIQSARTALIWTIVGGLILLGATAIKLAITDTITSISS